MNTVGLIYHITSPIKLIYLKQVLRKMKKTRDNNLDYRIRMTNKSLQSTFIVKSEYNNLLGLFQFDIAIATDTISSSASMPTQLRKLFKNY